MTNPSEELANLADSLDDFRATIPIDESGYLTMSPGKIRADLEARYGAFQRIFDWLIRTVSRDYAERFREVVRRPVELADAWAQEWRDGWNASTPDRHNAANGYWDVSGAVGIAIDWILEFTRAAGAGSGQDQQASENDVATAADICDTAVVFLQWLDKRTVPKDNGQILPRTHVYDFRKLANHLQQAWYLAVYVTGDAKITPRMQEGYRAFADSVGFDDSTFKLLAMNRHVRVTDLMSPIHDQWELSTNPTRLATVRRALELIAECAETDQQDNADTDSDRQDQQTEAPPKRRPAYDRDHLFLEWYEKEGATTYHSHAKIRDKWNAMTKEEREQIAPELAGKVTRDTVITAVKTAQQERNGT